MTNRRIGRLLETNEPCQLSWKDGRITGVEECPALPANIPEDTYICPGMIDIQINGFTGIDFGNPNLTTSQVQEIATKLWETGTTHILPTLITDSADRMTASLARLSQAAEQPDLEPMILGLHLEGPYLSPADGPRGAHPLEFCKDPDFDEFQRMQESAGGRIRLVTLAPERPGSLRFIEQAVDQGVRIAIGHSAATRRKILDAVSAGASLATHLGNAAHDQLQRHHNYVYDQLGEDRLWASLIVDGHHLPPHLVKIFLRAKGTRRTILISDAVQYAGLEPGIYDAGYRKFEVREGGFIGVVGEPRLAGSGLLMIRGVENLVRFTGISLAEAFRCATANPAVYLGLDDRLGSLHPGKEASFSILRWDPENFRAEVMETVLAGKAVFSRN